MLATYDQDNGFRGPIKRMHPITQNVKDGFKQVFERNNNSGNLNDWSGDFRALAESCEITDRSFQTFLERTRESETVYNSAEDMLIGYRTYLEETGQAASTAALKTKVLSSAMSALSSLGWTAIISVATALIGKGIEKLSDMANETEIVTEKGRDFASSVASATSDYASNSSTLSGLNAEYQKLSQGVSDLGENVSLSADEYSRYLDIVNQISGIMPNLGTYFDAQGNKIGFVKGQLADLNEEYEKHIQQQAQKFLTDGNENGNTFQDTLTSFEKTKEGSKGFMESFKISFKQQFGNYSMEDIPAASMLEALEGLQNAPAEEVANYLNDIEIAPNGQIVRDADTDLKLAIGSLLEYSPNEIQAMETDSEEYQSVQQSIASYIQQLKADTNTKMNDVKTGLIQTAYADDDFWALDSEQAQNSVTTLLSSFSYDSWSQLGMDTEHEVTMFVSGIIDAIGSNKGGLADAWNGLFALDTSTLNSSEYIEQADAFMTTIADVLGLDEEGKKSFAQNLGISLDNSEIISNVKGKISTEVDAESLSMDDLETLSSADKETIEKYAVQEKDKLNRRTKKSRSGKAAKVDETEVYQNVAERLRSGITDVLDFDDAWSSIGENSDLKGFKDSVTELADAGHLTAESFQELDGSDEFLKMIGLTAEEAADRVNQLSDSTSQLQSLSNGISSMTDALSQKKENGFVDVDSLAGFDAEIKGLSSWKEFETLLGSSTSSIEDCQNAANQLAAEWMNSNNFLANLNDTNKEYYITQLQNMGITNAAAVVEASLAAKKVQSRLAAIDLNTATQAEKQALLDEINAAYGANYQLSDLYKLKMGIMNTPINSIDDIDQLIALAVQANASANELYKLQRIKTFMDGGQVSDNLNENQRQEQIAARQYKSAKEKENTTPENPTAPNLSDLDPGKYKAPAVGGGPTSPSTPAAPEPAPVEEAAVSPFEQLKKWLSTFFDWIEVRLERQTDKISKYTENADRAAENRQYNTARRNYRKAISSTSTQIGYQNEAKNLYANKANQVLAQAVGTGVIDGNLAESIKKGVAGGTMNINEYSEEVKEVISSYQTWTDKSKKAADSIAELHQNIRKYIQDLKDLTDAQRDASIEKAKTYAGIVTSGNSVSTTSKNQGIDAENKALNAQNKAYGKATASWKNETNFKRKGSAAKKAYNAASPTGVKDKAYRKALKNAQKAIKSRKAISAADLKTIRMHDRKKYETLSAYNFALSQYKLAKEEQSVNYAETISQIYDNISDKSNNRRDNYLDKIDLRQKEAENAVGAKEKNSLITKATNQYSSIITEDKKTINKFSDKITSAAKTIRSKNVKGKTDKARNLIKTIQKLVKNRKPITKHLDDVAKQVKAGNISESFYEACVRYDKALDKKKEAEDQLKIDELTQKQERENAALEKMSNISAEAENKRSENNQKRTSLDNHRSLLEAKGYGAGESYYSSAIAAERANSKSQEEELDALEKSLVQSIADGSIAIGSDAWYEAQEQINNVRNSVKETTVSIAELESEMQQLKWDRFEALADRIRNVTAESDFIINELSRGNLTSEESGSLTDKGKAAAALHASNYQTYLSLAEKYKHELANINKQIANDPYNETLLEQKQALTESYQDAVSSAQEEKEAVISLYTEGYEALQDKISELIDDYEDLLDSEKDAYDYQQRIADSVKNISSIKKQIAALQGDASEETKAKLQELRVSLEEAERDLQETQYDQMISDTKDMLSDFQEDLSDSIEDIISSLSDNFGRLITDLNNNSGTVVQTIKEEMSAIGYTSSDEFKNLLSGIANTSSIADASTKVVIAITAFQMEMEHYFDKLAEAQQKEEEEKAEKKKQEEADADAKAKKAEQDKKAQEDGKNKLSKDKTAAANSYKKAASEVTDARKDYQRAQNAVKTLKSSAEYKSNPKKYASKLKKLQDQETKAKKKLDAAKTKEAKTKKAKAVMEYLDKHLSVTSSARSGLSDLNKVFYDRYGQRILSTSEVKNLAKEIGVKFDNEKKSGKLYRKLKDLGINGFQSGSRSIAKKQVAVLGENGAELHYSKSEGTLQLVGAGDKVYTKEMSENLWQMSRQSPDFLSKIANAYTPLSSAKHPANNTVTISFGDLTLPNVTDSREFADSVEESIRNAMCRNGKTLQCVTEAVSSNMLGNGSGSARLYR